MSANPKQQTPDEIAAQIVNARDLFRRARRFDIFHGFEGPLLSTAENFTYIVERQRGRIRDLEQERDEFGESARAYHAALELMFKRAESAEQANKELLEACSMMRREYSAFGTLSQETLMQAERAIAKAEGRR